MFVLVLLHLPNDFCLCDFRFGLNGRLRKVSHKDVPLVSSLESADSLNDPFVPNGFAMMVLILCLQYLFLFLP